VLVTDEDEEDQEETDCEQLQQEAAKALQLLQQIRQRRKEIQAELRQLAKDLKSGQAKVPKLELEIGNCDTTRENLTKLIPQLEQQVVENEADHATLAELEARVSACEADLAVCTEQAAALEKEKEGLQKAILDAGGSKWKKQQNKCNKIKAAIDETEKKIRSAKVAISTGDKNMVKAEQAQSKAVTQLEKYREDYEQHQTDLKALEEDAFAVMQAYEKVKALEAEKKEELEEADKEFKTLSESQSSAKCTEIELLGQLETLDKQVGESQIKARQWQSEMTKIEKAAKKDEAEWGDLSEDEEEDVQNNADSYTSEEEKESDGDAAMDDAEASGPPSNSSTSSLPVYSIDALVRYDRESAKERIATLEAERNTIAKNANLGAIAEYRKKEAEYLTRYV
jgi:chromosome segregation ATPase